MRHHRQDDLQRAARLDGRHGPVRVVGAHAAPTRPVAEEEQRGCRWEEERVLNVVHTLFAHLTVDVAPRLRAELRSRLKRTPIRVSAGRLESL
eukprot:1647025-Prymnesium_polylepis.1